MWAFTANFQPSLNSPIPLISISSRSSHSRVCPKPTLICSSLQSQVETLNGTTDGRISERNEIRFGLPSKGRMATDTLELLKVHYSASFLFCLLFFFIFLVNVSSCLIFFSLACQDCQLSVKQVNPRQYVANIPQVLASLSLSMHLMKELCF